MRETRIVERSRGDGIDWSVARVLRTSTGEATGVGAGGGCGRAEVGGRIGIRGAWPTVVVGGEKATDDGRSRSRRSEGLGLAGQTVRDADVGRRGGTGSRLSRTTGRRRWRRRRSR